MKYITFILVALIASLCIQSTQAQDTIKCDICEYILSYAEQYVQQNKSVSEIEVALDDACKILPKTLSANCQIIVNSYAPLIIDMLINKEDPQTICAQVKLCTSSNNNVATFQKKTIKPKGTALECDLCQWVVARVESYVSNNSTETQILAFLDNDCQLLKNQNWVSECQTLVNDYAPLIIQYVENDESPATICAQIGICTSNNTQKVSGADCPLCTMVVSYVEQYVANNKTEQEMEAFLEKECGKLDTKWATTCQTVVANYLPSIITYVENGATAAQICQGLGMCTPPSVKKVAPQAGALVCEICEIVLQDVFRYVGNNATEQEILSKVENDCTYFRNQQFVQECQTFVSTYGEILINYVLKSANPEKACDDLDLCSSSSSSSNNEDSILKTL